jgi:anti-sigma factor RsiW
MSSVRPEELSALIDGELDPQRARVVEARIAVDRALQREFDTLRALDHRWSEAARSSGFPVHVGLTSSMHWRRCLLVGAVVIMLLGVRVAARLIDPWPIALTLQSAVLVGILFWLTGAARQRDFVGRAVTEL